jgi:DNA-binding CsgD family transcriptional regulator
VSGPASLTAAERRVAKAATAGWSNREIAARLYLSPKTVEMHLGRAYRNLDIRLRAELPNVLAEAARTSCPQGLSAPSPTNATNRCPCTNHCPCNQRRWS